MKPGSYPKSWHTQTWQRKTTRLEINFDRILEHTFYFKSINWTEKIFAIFCAFSTIELIAWINT
jgi:hypothetical protein